MQVASQSLTHRHACPCSRRQQQAAAVAAAPPCAAAASAGPAAAGSSLGHRRWKQQQHGELRLRRRSVAAASGTGFHQSLLVATERTPGETQLPLPPLTVREAEEDAELQAASWLRAFSFYRYPEERKFAAEVHRTMVAEEEFKALKVARMNRRLDGAGGSSSNERSACLVALCSVADLSSSASGDAPVDNRLLVSGSGDSGLAVVGTLDLYAARALEGEVLIGDSRNAAYLANVCTAAAARRRGVGQQLLAAARQVAVSWGVDAMYVHTMAVNEIAMRFYERNGFVVEKEESSNQAHYRGRCLDGIEGRGRTVLLRDTRLHG